MFGSRAVFNKMRIPNILTDLLFHLYGFAYVQHVPISYLSIYRIYGAYRMIFSVRENIEESDTGVRLNDADNNNMSDRIHRHDDIFLVLNSQRSHNNK